MMDVDVVVSAEVNVVVGAEFSAVVVCADIHIDASHAINIAIIGIISMQSIFTCYQH